MRPFRGTRPLPPSKAYADPCGSGLVPRKACAAGPKSQSRFKSPGNCATSFWLLKGARMNPR
ncbi:hypothetical protein C1X72_14960 [Pseudomonas sp. FW306-2-2C-D06B]|nr:hypothetical protein C1X72_14960 [Pseudomonas sp. FW306-2-2C-D06B]